jgi:beta-fructofuranosidase
LQAELRSAGIEGNAGRLDVIFEPGEAEEIGIGLYGSPDGAEETRVVFRLTEGLVKVDRSHSSLAPDQDRKEFTAPLRLAKGEAVNATLFLDRSLVEIYLNETCCLTTRVYPSRADSVGIRFFGGGRTTLVREATWRTIRHRTS